MLLDISILISRRLYRNATTIALLPVVGLEGLNVSDIVGVLLIGTTLESVVLVNGPCVVLEFALSFH